MVTYRSYVGSYWSFGGVSTGSSGHCDLNPPLACAETLCRFSVRPHMPLNGSRSGLLTDTAETCVQHINLFFVEAYKICLLYGHVSNCFQFSLFIYKIHSSLSLVTHKLPRGARHVLLALMVQNGTHWLGVSLTKTGSWMLLLSWGGNVCVQRK